MTNKTPTTAEWKKLTPYEQARQCSEMWLDSRDPHTQAVLRYSDTGPIVVNEKWTPALFTAFREVFDNALDEVAAHKNGDRIDVFYDETTGVISVEDNGRGVPIEWVESEQKYAATILLSEQFAGRNFEDRGQTRGMNGVGAAIVNFTSEYYNVDIKRDKKSFSQKFEEGDKQHVVHDPMIFPETGRKTGTKIEFKPSPRVFHDRSLPQEFVQSRIIEASLCYPGVKFFFNGKAVKTRGVEQTVFPNMKTIPISINVEGFKSDFWLVPNFLQTKDDYTHSMVNAIPVFSGGIHVETFRRIFYDGILTALERESNRLKLMPNRQDVGRGMMIYNITQMDAPKFNGQAKTKLINEHVAKIISAEMGGADFFKNLVKKHPDWVAGIFERCAARTSFFDDRESKKAAKQMKKTKIKELVDAVGRQRNKCILFLTEGDSAVGGLTDERDAEIHGAMPLRGKIRNVWNSKPKDVTSDEVLKKIMGAIGLDPNERAARPLLRYGRIYITCDADEDGKSIAGQLVNFFFKFWPELFDPENPFIYVFDTPLIIASKGKTKKYWYNEDYDDFDPKQYSGWDVTRAKGLAAMKGEDWRYALANEKIMPIVDDGDLAEALKIIFSKEEGASDTRKAWMQ